MLIENPLRVSATSTLHYITATSKYKNTVIVIQQSHRIKSTAVKEEKCGVSFFASYHIADSTSYNTSEFWPNGFFFLIDWKVNKEREKEVKRDERKIGTQIVQYE